MLINENLICLNLEASNQEEALYKMAEIAKEEGRISDVRTYVEAVLHRES